MGRQVIKPKKTKKQEAEEAFLKGIDRRVIEMTPKEVEEFLSGIKGKLETREEDVVVGMAASLQMLIAEVKRGKVAFARIEAILFGAKTEKTSKICPESKEEGDADSDKKEDKGEEKDEEKVKKPGHGPNGVKGLPGAQSTRVNHESLKSGDPCPECPKGKIYPLPDYGVMVRFIGMAPIKATVYELEKFRCNACGSIFTAVPPEEAGPKKYDETVSAAVGMVKYGAGVPFARLERLQKHLGVPLPKSNQWELVDEASDLLDPVLGQLIHLAAQGDVIYQDDTTMKILNRPDLVVARKGKERKGVYTTGIVSHVSVDGAQRSIALFITGMHHAGENLAEVLKKRSEALSRPIQMCDASSSNTKGGFETMLAHCMAHARRRFVGVVDSFPEECRYLLENIGEVYKNDGEARKMSRQERLLYHQATSGPVMEKLHKWLHDQIEGKKVEPRSCLGEAIQYMLKHWEPLTLFLREPGAPLDNNLCERALKRAVLHRKNSLFYKTLNGAYVGDLFMSLIHTAELSDANPFDYLVQVQKSHALAKKNPQAWMPWNYQKTLAALTQ